PASGRARSRSARPTQGGGRGLPKAARGGRVPRRGACPSPRRAHRARRLGGGQDRDRGPPHEDSRRVSAALPPLGGAHANGRQGEGSGRTARGATARPYVRARSSSVQTPRPTASRTSGGPGDGRVIGGSSCSQEATLSEEGPPPSHPAADSRESARPNP